jgi:hypothetical protein
MPSRRTRNSILAFSAVLAASVLAGASEAQATTIPGGLLPGGWSAQHGPATATGAVWWTHDLLGITQYVNVNGTLTASSSACYSLWMRLDRGTSTGSYTKETTRCGPGSAQIAIKKSFYGVFPATYVKICADTTSDDVCGTPVKILG